MISLIIGYWCLGCFTISQLALLFIKYEEFTNKRVDVHIASAIYALAAGYLLK